MRGPQEDCRWMQCSQGGAQQNPEAVLPSPPLRKHQERQKNDSQTGSQCLDKAVLARDVRYQPSHEERH